MWVARIAEPSALAPPWVVVRCRFYPLTVMMRERVTRPV